MKLPMIFLLLALIGALVVGPMYITGPGGKPIMTADDWTPDALEQPMDLTAEAPSGVFSWTDEHGTVHFSDTRPSHLADDAVQNLDVGLTMTLPSEAFTGPEQEADELPSDLPEPLRVLLRRGEGGNKEADGTAATTPGGQSVNDALAEIATRFPQFQAMSDSLAKQMSQPKEEQ